MGILDYQAAKPETDQLLMDELNAKCREILSILPNKGFDNIDVLVKVLSYEVYLHLTKNKKCKLNEDELFRSLNNISMGMAKYICTCNFESMTSKARG